LACHAALLIAPLAGINRVMLRTGTLARYVRDLAVTGLTSNPTILGHAMAAGSDYDRSLARLAGEGVTDARDLVYALALEDLTEAAALFRPEWEQTEGVDGYVSLEVPPDVAYDAAATVALARRLHDQADFPNLLVKIPGTPQGLLQRPRYDGQRGERDALAAGQHSYRPGRGCR
jgi:transaldolase